MLRDNGEDEHNLKICKMNIIPISAAWPMVAATSLCVCLFVVLAVPECYSTWQPIKFTEWGESARYFLLSCVFSICGVVETPWLYVNIPNSESMCSHRVLRLWNASILSMISINEVFSTFWM